ncbi:MAG: PQQ-binding-like beta-propeller repeat protein, partial [Verrucomicrobia bacterium]|nr:PQQ-binding-like beta-propeller repeat protein [Verrucomicrobiota bacterium]
MKQNESTSHRRLFLLTACLVWIVGPSNGLPQLLGAAPGTVAWRVERPGSRWGTPAVAPDGSIYAVAAPPLPGRSVLVALQPGGAERWNAELAPGQYHPPMVNSTGNVIVTRSGSISIGPLTCTPGRTALTFASIVSVSSNSIDALTAFSLEGTPLWNLGLRLNHASIPVLQADDSVHLGGSDPLRPATYAIVAADGSLRARGPMQTLSGGGSPEPVSGLPPHIGSDGTVVYLTFGSFYLSPVPVAVAVSNAFPVFVQGPAGAAAVGPGDRMAIPQADGLSLRTADGEEFARWRGGEVTSSPVSAANGTLFFGSLGNRLHAVSESGEELWSVDTGDVVRSTPVLLESGAVAAVTASGRLFAVDSSGLLLWELRLTEPVTAHLNMLPDGRILVGGDGGTLWCVESGFSLAEEGWPKWQGDPANRGRSLAAPVPLTAPEGVSASDKGGLEVRWRSVPGARSYRVWRDARPDFSSAELVRSTSFPAIADFRIQNGVEHFYRVEAVRGSEIGPPSAPVSVVPRKLLWRKVIADTTSGIAAQQDGTLIVTAGVGKDRWLMALDPDGVERWRRPLTWLLYQPPVVTADDTIWVNAGHELHQFKSDGTPGVTVPSGAGPGLGLPGPLAVGQDGALYVVSTASQRA